MFLKISKNSQGNTCVKVIKAILKLHVSSKILNFEFEYCKIIKNTFCAEYLCSTSSERVTDSKEILKNISKKIKKKFNQWKQ